MEKAASEKSKSSRGTSGKKRGDGPANGNDADIHPSPDPTLPQQNGETPTGANANVDGSSPPVGTGEEKVDESLPEAVMTKIQGSAHEGTGTSISSQIQKIIAKELVTPSRKGTVDLQSVPMREYLEQTVIPIIHQGMLALGRERPDSPIEYLAAYFLKHKHKYQFGHEQQPQQDVDSGSPQHDNVDLKNESQTIGENLAVGQVSEQHSPTPK